MKMIGPRGVIAAIATPLDKFGQPDTAELIRHARHLLDAGCDGLNLLGTTGEATSFSVEQRLSIMRAVAHAGLPLDCMMVGTGSTAIADAKFLTQEAAKLGFAGVLVLPPFYYKPVKDEGIADFIGSLVQMTLAESLPIYLYNFPALTGIPYTAPLVRMLRARFGSRIAGLKDSSGDLPYAREMAALSPEFAVFPSSEATLLEARKGAFAGCISATANLNAKDCAAAFRGGDEAALSRAVRIRGLFDGLPLVPGIKAVLAIWKSTPEWANLLPPLTSLADDEMSVLKERLSSL